MIGVNRGSCSCPLCGSTLNDKLFDCPDKRWGDYAVFYCHHCKTGITNPFPDEDILNNIYSTGSYRSKDGGRFVAPIEGLVTLSSGLKRKSVMRFTERGSLLDIGCGRGLFLNMMKKAGFEVKGVEFNKETASYTKSVYGIDVVYGPPKSWGFNEGSFDVITLFHVLEHLPSPVQTLSSVSGLLKKGGLLIISVPNFDSLQARTGRGLWFHLDVPCHLFHFKEEGIKELLANKGFRVVMVKRLDIEQSLFGWIQTLLNLCGIRHNLLYGILKSSEIRIKETKEMVLSDILLMLSLLFVYTPLAVMLSLFESYVLKRGATVEIYALKDEE